MASPNIQSTGLGSELQQLLMAEQIVPGATASYQLCKSIYMYHPLGAKMTDSPVSMAQSQAREISVADGPEERLQQAFKAEWSAINADRHIFNVMRLARMYGIASVAVLVEGTKTNEPVDVTKLFGKSISFNVFDPLNTAGSLVMNQDPNAMDFQKTTGTLQVNGQVYHRSRTCVMLNEDPLYIEYTSSAFGFVGRSVYQRALYPMKSFVQSMVTDDMVVRKAGLLIAMIKQAGSIANNIMARMAGFKRALLKEAETNNVLSIDVDEKIETLNMMNVDGAFGMARKNILHNIAVAADMPAQFLNSETFAEGFGEGSEDAKAVANYIDKVRIAMAPLYEFFNAIVMHRAWNPDFYASIQKEFPEWGSIPYETAFYRWKNSFLAIWPSLITEPDSKKMDTEKVKMETLVNVYDKLTADTQMDPENKGRILDWLTANISENKTMFPHPLVLDIEAYVEYEPPQPMMGTGGEGDEVGGAGAPPQAEARQDSRRPRAVA